ncbi:hypothetical protein PENTCL1PPCAC_30752 [Pristionchus entomophagus]|uniref:C6 domain-containing protein n=1 Tax=Pristionchus entomophagus TaxID=358040 RepID=A0AAV5UQP8_9BILA|nr:hypothetical protein PENTCL1PPCAC_14495 [Pristionchus entomophagus]GMT08578.1 hypothetical protein PENTCL1PPCAC_30752 [Pristionchus entomophagus]
MPPAEVPCTGIRAGIPSDMTGGGIGSQVEIASLVSSGSSFSCLSGKNVAIVFTGTAPKLPHIYMTTYAPMVVCVGGKWMFKDVNGQTTPVPDTTIAQQPVFATCKKL